MLIVRGTKKLRDRVKGAPAPADSDASTTVLGDWFVTALFWKPQVAMLVNTRTFLPVFMPLAPASTLLDRIPPAIAEALAAQGIPPEQVEAELAEMSEVRLAPTNNRQVLGVMNEFVLQAEYQRDEADTDLLDLSLDLSQMILGPLMKSEGRPIDELALMFAPDATIIPFPGTIAPAAPAAPAGAAETKATRRAGTVHQIKVTLSDISPPVWRRIVVRGSEPLSHLHEVIQAAFGWYDSHLHMFEIDGVDYGIPSEDDWTPVKDERRRRIDQVVGAGSFEYVYDFGDNWVHKVVVEKSFREGDHGVPATVPDCVGGRRACPPEDCGGPWGYAEMLEILEDPQHPEYDERVEWLGQPFDPEAFDPADFADNLALQKALDYDGRW